MPAARRCQECHVPVPDLPRPVLIAATVVAALLLALLAVGAFPPEADPRPVERVLPNDRFQTR